MAVIVHGSAFPCLFLSLTTLLLLSIVLHCPCLVTAQTQAVASAASGQPACGTKFVDVPSSALLADIVLKGSVQELRQASPVTPLLYTARVRVHKVYKGQDVLRYGRNPNSSSRLRMVQVERFGPNENKEKCVGHVVKNETYVFFVKVKDSVDEAMPRMSTLISLYEGLGRNGSVEFSTTPPRPPAQVLVNTALPHLLDGQTVRKVKKVLCPDCSSVPVIRRIKCKHCAVEPAMKKPMSANSTQIIRTGKRLSLRCAAKGSPKPRYSWYKDGRVLYSPSKREEGSGRGRTGESGPRHGRNSRLFRDGTMSVRNSKHFSLLVIRKVKSKDQGSYVCLATNAMGEFEQRVQVVVEGKSRSRPSKSNRHSTRSPRTPQYPGPQAPSSPSSTPQPDLLSQTTPGDDPCAFNHCYNGGSCYTEEGGLTRCQCVEHFHGNRCQFRRRSQSQGKEDEGEIENNIPDTTVPRPGGVEEDDDVSYDDEGDNNNDTLVNDGVRNSTETVARAVATVTATNTYPIITSNRGPFRVTDISELRSVIRPTPDTTINTSLTKKKRRKYGVLARGDNPSAKRSKTGVAPRLKVTECPDVNYCLNGGTCKIVVKIQRRFCLCPKGSAGRRCEYRV